MDKLLEVVNQQASSAMPVADFDENSFQQFMTKKSSMGFSCYFNGWLFM